MDGQKDRRKMKDWIDRHNEGKFSETVNPVNIHSSNMHGLNREQNRMKTG